jgi:hypothetical protein
MQTHFVGRKRADNRLQPTAFVAGTRGESCQLSLWLWEQVLPESAAAEPGRWAAMVNHCSTLTGYNFLSLSLAVGTVKRQSILFKSTMYFFAIANSFQAFGEFYLSKLFDEIPG